MTDQEIDNCFLCYHAFVIDDNTWSTDYAFTAGFSGLDEPNSIREARKHKDWITKDKNGVITGWQHGIMDELGSFFKRRVVRWVKVSEIPPDHKILSSRFVFKTKLDKNNDPYRWRARWVSRGFEQRENKEFFDNYASVCNIHVIKLLISLAVYNDWIISTTDVSKAFTYSKAEVVQYMDPPAGLELVNDPALAQQSGYELPPTLPEGSTDRYVLECQGEIYGSKSAAAKWFQHLGGTLKQNGFDDQIIADSTVYLKKSRCGTKFVLLAVVVDDLIEFHNKKANDMFDGYLSNMRDHYDITHEEGLNFYCGIGFETLPDGSVKASMSAYIDRCLERFHITDINTIKTPAAYGFNVRPCDVDENPTRENLVLYQSMCGSLIYAATVLRGDIAWIVGLLMRFMTKPSKFLINAAMRVFRYLKHTKDRGPRFVRKGQLPEGQEGNILYAFTDTSHGDCLFTYRTTGSYSLMINGVVFMYRVGRLPLQTISTCESEYIQLSLTTPQILWIRELLEKIDFPQAKATPIFVDNSSAEALATNPCINSRTRHIPIRFHFVRRHITENRIIVIHIDTKHQLADLGTKALSLPVHERHSKKFFNEQDILFTLELSFFVRVSQLLQPLPRSTHHLFYLNPNTFHK